MKNKKLLLPIIILIVAVLLSAGYGVVTGMVKQPVTKEAEFPFSITYKYNSETVTINEKYVCEFSGASPAFMSQNNFWNAYIEGYAGSDYYFIDETEAGTLYICPNLYAGYLMGDPQEEGYYSEDVLYQPYALLSGADGVEYTDAKTIAAQGIEIISWDYPQPIENQFVFAGISPISGDSVIPMLVIAVLALVACIIFVKRENNCIERNVAYKIIDKVSLILNLVIGVVIIPAMTAVSILLNINGYGTDLIYQIIYCVPAFSVLCLALSLSLRRKGFGKSSLVIQFIGPVMFVVVMVIFGLIMR